MFNRKPSAATAIACIALVVALGGTTLAASRNGITTSSHKTLRLAPYAGLLLRSAAFEPVAGVGLTPALEAGSLGWRVTESLGAGCCFLPTHEVAIVSESKGFRSKWITATVLAVRGVAAVSVEGRKPVRTRSRGLPFGLRFAMLPLKDARAHSPVAFNARGQRIDVRGFSPLPKRHEFEGPFAPHRWQMPQTPPVGACELTSTDLPGLASQGGAVVARVKGYRVLDSRAFQSCANTDYTLEGQALEGAILLDAEHPGTALAPLPGLKAITGATGFVDTPGASVPRRAGVPLGGLTAERLPGAWLVVAGGTGPAERLDVLRHLHASIHV